MLIATGLSPFLKNTDKKLGIGLSIRFYRQNNWDAVLPVFRSSSSELG